MPLKFESDAAGLETMVGATFVMTDVRTGASVRCRVTYEALTDRSAFDNDGDSRRWIETWKANREAIGNLASANFDAGKEPRHGFQMVDTLELTPLDPKGGYFQKH